MKQNVKKTLGYVFSIFLAAHLFVGCATTPPPIVKDLKVVDKRDVPQALKDDITPSKLGDHKKIRIGLRIDVPSSDIHCDGSVKLKDMVSKKWVSLEKGTFHCRARGKRVVVNGKTYGRKVLLTPNSRNTPLVSNKTKVRGVIYVVATSPSKITVINELPLGGYLKGVLPREIIASWPEEALKAQAVASRTYLVSHLGQYKEKGFDLCADINCQVYGGMNKENSRTSRAVEETSGEILTYKGRPISAYFHANSGGHTESASAVWALTSQPYLPSKPSPYGQGAPWYNWSRTFTKSEILRNLRAKNLVKGSSLKSIRVAKKSKSGRAEKVAVATNRGTYTMSGNTFRIALDPGKMRSTLWTKMGPTGNGYTFAGRGWGHGVGMCQWGAHDQAQKGKSYRQILSFYYPFTKLSIWK